MRRRIWGPDNHADREDATVMAGNESLDERAVRIAEELWGVGENIGGSEGRVDADDVADGVHSVVSAAAHALRALADWYAERSAEIFDDRQGAEQDATETALQQSAELRAFAAELQALAGRHAPLIATLDHLEPRGDHEVPPEELADEDEYYAVVEVDYAAVDEATINAYDRLDVARYFAQRRARVGTPGNVYRVVPVIDGEPGEHLAEWPGLGEGEVDETLRP